MKVQDIEIPPAGERSFWYRFYEILPGVLSWSILALPFILSFIDVRIVAFLMIAYLLLWFVKAVGLNIRVVQSWNMMKQHKKIPWQKLIDCLDPEIAEEHRTSLPKWHFNNLKRIAETPNGINAREVIHAVIIATYNETREVLEPTIQAVLDSDFDTQKVILILAYEERGGERVEEQANQLMSEYGAKVLYAEAVKHPHDIPGEVLGKGGNITFAGRRLKKIVEKLNLDTNHILVTTLDSDNRPHPQYLANLTYIYAACHEPKHKSFQPLPMFTNNIWDAPAPMRVIATGNSYWMMVQATRPHMLRNFSSHAQPLSALIDTDFWSVRTIVEDGHQFWRTYFRYDGNHDVIPIFLPIYQDAVLSDTYRKTLKAQFIQLRRWAWGVSDIAYVVNLGFLKKSSINWFDKWSKLLRLMEGHISWATSPLILAFGSIIPWVFHNKDFLANQLPQIASRIQTVAMIGILITLFLSFKILPPKPERYKRHRSIWMIFQWILLPITTICYSSFAALTSQTRLIFGRYLDKFDVTEKAVKTDSGVIGSLKND